MSENVRWLYVLKRQPWRAWSKLRDHLGAARRGSSRATVRRWAPLLFQALERATPRSWVSGIGLPASWGPGRGIARHCPEMPADSQKAICGEDLEQTAHMMTMQPYLRYDRHFFIKC